MAEKIAELFIGIPANWVTFFIGMMPIAELRGAIPWAMSFGKMPWNQALIWALIGNAIPIVPALLLMEPASNLLRKIRIFDKFLSWLFERTRRRGKKVIEKYKAVGLAMFVSIPLPGTGIWTGAVAAYVFGIKFKYALPALVAGMLFAGIMVTLACKGVLEFLKVFI